MESLEAHLHLVTLELEAVNAIAGSVTGGACLALDLSHQDDDGLGHRFLKIRANLDVRQVIRHCGHDRAQILLRQDAAAMTAAKRPGEGPGLGYIGTSDI